MDTRHAALTMRGTPHLSLESVSKRYDAIHALDGFDLAVETGELLTLLGPSGCGKTTVLRLVAGFVAPTDGRILIGGKDVTRVLPSARGIGMVFQSYALFPHLSIARNVAFGLEERGLARAHIRRRVADLLDLVRLTEAADRYPAELSGGQQQRVALARAVAYAPQLLLMDEPLGALDLKLREAMQLEIRRVQRELGITTLYVTHDQTEAMRISDRIAIMDRGRIVQLGTAPQIYDTPATRFVADFLGKINLFAGKVTAVEGAEMRVHSALGDLRLPHRRGADVGAAITLGVRPDEIKIKRAGECGGPGGMGIVAERSFLGNVVELRVRLADDSLAVIEAKPAEGQAHPGDAVKFGCHASHVKVFVE
jgi:spermidine/putrescine ABC transporter ATP-binding subunit